MWRDDPLRAALLCWTALLSMLIWLPLVRGATQGEAYHWALASGIGGSGTGGSYWMLIPALAFVLSLLYLGWRGGRQPFHWLLLGFHLPLASAVTYDASTDPNGLRLEGATVGLDVSLAVLGQLLFGGAAIAAIVWVIRDLRTGRSRTLAPWVWTRAARLRLLLLVALVPLEVVLFHSGGMKSVQNMIGVGLVGWQWVLVNLILAKTRAPSA